MDYWHSCFKYPITPKRGPMPQMFSLIDARGAFLELPQGFLRRPHWLRAGQALLTASQTGRLIDIQWAFDTIVAAVDEEGWFDLGGEDITTEPPAPDQTAHRPETERLTPRVIFQGGGMRRGVTRASVRSGAAQSRAPRSADHIHGSSYFLLRRQSAPSQHSLLQCGAISQNARSIVQCRRLPGIDIDFVVLAHQGCPILSGPAFHCWRGWVLHFYPALEMWRRG